MHLSRETNLLVLRAGNPEERSILREIAAAVSPGAVLEYMGREGADHGSSPDQRMLLKFKLNGRQIVLRATDDEEEKIVRSLRDCIYMGRRHGVIILDSEDTSDGPKVRVAPELCAHCQQPVASLAESEWSTCDDCAGKCSHEYKRGMVHGGPFGSLGVAEYCTKCGRGKPLDPDQRIPGQIERELAVQKEFGIVVQYKGAPPGVGPAEVAKIERLNRRLERARARKEGV